MTDRPAAPRWPTNVFWFSAGTVAGVAFVFAAAVGPDLLEDGRHAWEQRTAEQGEAEGRREAQKDRVAGRLVVNPHLLASWQTCEVIPIGYDLAHDLETDPERALNCTVNAWRTCAFASALTERLGVTVDSPLVTDLVLPPEDLAPERAYGAAMAQVARERFGPRIDSLVQDVVAGRVDAPQCDGLRDEAVRVGALVAELRWRP